MSPIPGRDEDNQMLELFTQLGIMLKLGVMKSMCGETFLLAWLGTSVIYSMERSCNKSIWLLTCGVGLCRGPVLCVADCFPRALAPVWDAARCVVHELLCRVSCFVSLPFQAERTRSLLVSNGGPGVGLDLCGSFQLDIFWHSGFLSPSLTQILPAFVVVSCVFCLKSA